MLTVTALALAFVLPLLVVIGLLALAARVQRARDAISARQVAVTDAIHRELGAVAAPVVRKRAWGPWQVQIAVDFERPALVNAVLAVAYEAFGRFDRLGSVRFVLVPREAVARVKVA
jgi:hypothetical protein